MPLELRVEPNRTLRPLWYGRFKIHGKRLCVQLGVKVQGTPPASLSLREMGDTAFERSRAAAQAKLDQIVEEARRKRDAAHLVEKLYEIKTGEAIRSVKLSDLADEWAKIPRRHKPSARYAGQCQSTLRRFTEFVKAQNGKVKEIAQITRTLARAFLDAEAERGVTGKTWNDTLKLLRATFKYLLPAGAANPFGEVPTKDTETVFRKPFSPEELKAIVAVAKDDEFIRPIIVTGMCTAMRRGDCCLLEWKDVDLGKGFITVKTSKTGQTVDIPVFPMLHQELSRKAEGRGQKAEGGRTKQGHPGARQVSEKPAPPGEDEGRGRGRTTEGFVFPEQAQMYLENPDGITWRVKKVLASALASTGSTADDTDGRGLGKSKHPTSNAEHRTPNIDGEALPEVSREEARRKGLEYIASLAEGEKRGRMTTVFNAYMDGKSLKAVVAESGVSRGSASNYLNEIGKNAGCKIVRGRAANRKQKAEDSGLQSERQGGMRRASVRDCHSFRVTWVTLALTAGVPLELVQRVTGHKTTDIVLKHYFQPGREAFRDALQAAMPALLTNGEGRVQSAESGAEGKAKREAEVVQILKGMTAKTWKQDQARLVKMLEGEWGRKAEC
jgi:integrase